jgi:hypothetical protein
MKLSKIWERMIEFAAMQELVLEFLEHHNSDLSGLSLDDLGSSEHTIDKQIYEMYKDIPPEVDWESDILAIKDYKIPKIYTQGVPLPIQGDEETYSESIILGSKDTTNLLEQESSQSTSNGWSFQSDIAYFLQLIPTVDTSHIYEDNEDNEDKMTIACQASSIIDNQLATQSDVQSFETPYDYQHGLIPLDAITGYFDSRNSKELVLRQINNTVSVDEIVLSSLKEYNNICEWEVDFLTKSQACNILNIDGKQQIATVSLSKTEFKVEIYYFDNGEKVLWGASELFSHNIGLSTISSFNISISEMRDNGTIEISAIVSKTNRRVDESGPKGFISIPLVYIDIKTNLISIDVDIRSKNFSLVSNENIANFAYVPMPFTDSLQCVLQQHIYHLEGFIYLSYLSAPNTVTISARRRDKNSYIPIWHEDHKLADNSHSHSCSSNTLLYKYDTFFYFVRPFYSGSTECHVHTYQHQSNGKLDEKSSIKINTDDGLVIPFWGGFFLQDAFYVIKTGIIFSDFSRNEYILYRIDEENSRVRVELVPPTGRIHPSLVNRKTFGEPVIALSKYAIKAHSPNISTFTECLQPIAILDAPPISSLIDYPEFNGVAVHPSLSYQFKKQESSETNIEVKTERTKSDNFGIGFNAFGAKAEETINNKITKSSNQAHGQQFQLTQDAQITSEVQDIVVFLGITFTLYEYPITVSGEPSGHFLFFVPTSEPHSIINTGQLAFRKTSHQIGNLLSYPFNSPDPEEVQEMLYTNQFSINSNESYQLTVTYRDLKVDSSSNATTVITTVNKLLSLDMEFPAIKSVASIINSAVVGNYSSSEIKITHFTIEDSFTLEIQIPKLKENDATKNFSIEPYLYIDKSNILRCSYRVDIPSGGATTPTYWKDLYKYPKFGMVMPFCIDSFKDDSKYLLSFDIKTEPSDLVSDLESLDIISTVHNWSLVAGHNIEVGFYYMRELKRNPSREELVEIGIREIESINPRSSETVSITWMKPYIIKPTNVVPIYVLIDPDNKQQVMNKDNTFAQMNYPITSLSLE